MKKEKSFGQELIDAIDEALAESGTGHMLKPSIDLKALRKKLHLTQKQFAKCYHIKLETLKNWEQGERAPDSTSLAYLTCIAKKPEIIKNILNG